MPNRGLQAPRARILVARPRKVMHSVSLTMKRMLSTGVDLVTPAPSHCVYGDL